MALRTNWRSGSPRRSTCTPALENCPRTSVTSSSDRPSCESVGPYWARPRISFCDSAPYICDAFRMSPSTSEVWVVSTPNSFIAPATSRIAFVPSIPVSLPKSSARLASSTPALPVTPNRVFIWPTIPAISVVPCGTTRATACTSFSSPRRAEPVAPVEETRIFEAASMSLNTPMAAWPSPCRPSATPRPAPTFANDLVRFRPKASICRSAPGEARGGRPSLRSRCRWSARQPSQISLLLPPTARTSSSICAATVSTISSVLRSMASRINGWASALRRLRVPQCTYRE